MQSPVIAVVPALDGVPLHRPRSVRQAARAARRGAEKRTVYSHFLTEVVGRDGRAKWTSSRPGWRHNLTTDTASGYTNRRDWQAKALGGGSAPSAQYTGNATSTGSTSLTKSTATFPTAGQGLAGCIVACGPNSSGTGAVVFGVIVSNSSTVLTVDRWYDPTTWGAGSTPNGTCSFQILPGQMPAMFLAVTSDNASPSSADTTLASEATTNGFARALATWAHTAAASTYTLTVTFTASGSLTINKEAVFGAANTTGGGVMPFESAESNPPVLISGDSCVQVVTVTI